uniref:MYND-type domain-containing protein n=1 Tax=Anguilla anguilla TaxID=7936 RepID=A0A0E9X527_ANGAN
MDAEFCTTCGEKGAEKRCSICKTVIYCDQACQKLHWFTHKKVCKKLKDQWEKQGAESAKLMEKEQNAKDDEAVEDTTSSLQDLSVGQEEGSPSGSSHLQADPEVSDPQSTNQV